MIAGWLYVLTRYFAVALVLSALIAVLTSIFTDFTWKSLVVFRTPLLSRERFGKYFATASLATVIQYVITILLSPFIFYSFAYIISVAIGFLVAYTISTLWIWKTGSLS